MDLEGDYKMKRFFVLIILSFTLILGGCSGSGAENAMKEVFQAGLDKDTETLYRYFSRMEDFDMEDEDMDYFADALADEILESDGIENINIKEIKRKQIQSEEVAYLDEDFGKNWEVVLTRFPTEEDYVNSWILKKIDKKYYILDGEDYDTEELEDYFLK